MRLRIIITVLLSLVLLIGCSSNEDNSTTSENGDDNLVTETKADNDLESTKNDTADKNEEEESEEVEKVEEEITESELEELIVEQPLKVVETNYIVQSDEHKALYPDMLQAIIENNSGEDIKEAIIAFVAWDSNGLPLKLESSFELRGGHYVYKINAPDINLPDGEKWGYENGFEISEDLDVNEFKAIVVSYETFENDTWRNEYFDDFVRLYEGKKRK